MPLLASLLTFAAITLAMVLTPGPNMIYLVSRPIRIRPALSCVVLLLFGTPLTATAQAIRPVYREIGDWLLACDNTRSCIARSARDPARALANGEDEDAGMDIVREAGSGGAIQVRLRGGRRFDPAGVQASGITPLAGLPWRRGSDDEEANLSGDPARRFAQAAIDAPRLMLARTGPAHISLRGLAAILLAMDEAQGRVGNSSALVRPGPAPAGATPHPVLPPRITVARPAPPLRNGKMLVAAIRRLHAPVFAAHDCDRSPGDGDAAYPLTASEAIVIAGCGRFAYQSSVLAFRSPRNRPAAAALLRLPDPPTAHPTNSESAGEYVEGAYNPVTRTFSELAKGRGLADCGSGTEWTFDGETFRVSAFRRQERCGGAAPGDWPVLYRTRR